MHHQPTQRGYILLPVVLMITVIAAIAFLINHDTSINVNMTAAAIEAEKVEQVAQAGLAHAIWGVQNSGCAGDMAMTAVPFSQGVTNSYTATVDSGGATTTQYTFTPDRDGHIEEGASDQNHSGDDKISVVNKPGDTIHALYHYDLSSIPTTRQVMTATAWFYVDTEDNEGAVTLHPVTADWTDANLTWDAIGGQFDSSVYGTFPPQPDKQVWVSINVTALAQSWVSNPGSNYGFLLNATSDNKESKYTSRELSDTSLRPYLQITTADGAVSPVQITATGTLTGNPSPANDITRTLTRTDVPAYQPPGTITLQLGTDAGEDGMPDSFYKSRNYGAADYMQVNDDASGWQQYPLIRFDLAGLPRGAAVRSARLELRLQSLIAPGTASIHQVSRSWVEGTKSGTGVADGATWFTHDGTNPWTSAGGDINAEAVAETAIDGSETWVGWEIAPLVERWYAGEPNHGLQIRPGNGLEQANFASKEDATVGVQPKLTITWACECGRPCIAPQGSGTVLMVVINPTTLVSEDAGKKALFESWGYTVTVIGESENNTVYASAIAAADVVFISETVNSNQVGTKLANVPIGVVSQDGIYNDDLGITGGSAWAVDTAINVTDTSHYITALFPAGSLAIYDAGMEQLTVSGTEAPGLQTLTDTGGAGSLVVLDGGATGTGGTPIAGRRVMLPLGRDSSFNWDYLNSDGRLLVQRALQWGTGNVGGTPLKNLLFVSGGFVLVQFPSGEPLVTPTAEEQLRIDLIESWGYTVNLIADEDTQANFDTAVAAADVAYVSESVVLAQLAKKLKAATIGVVNEDPALHDVFGFSTVRFLSTTNPPMNTDAAHYITKPFGGAMLLALFSSSQPLGAAVGTLPSGLDTIGTWASGTMSPLGGLLTLDTGVAISGGGTAAGRRVQLPWGGQDGVSVTDITALTTDGRTIMQRAIEWAEGADGGSSTLIGHWMFDDGSGLTAIDSSGNGNNGTLTGDPEWITGTLAGALDFDAASDVVLVPDDPSLDITGPITLAAWIKPNVTGTEYVIRKAKFDSTDGYELSLSATGKVFFRLNQASNANTYRIDSTTSYPSDGTTWMHIAATYDGTNMRLYIDGVEEANLDAKINIATNNTDLSIGAQVDGSRGINGAIDDVRLYGEALSAAEIAELAVPSLTGPIAHWKLDDGTGLIAVDSVGGHDGTLTTGGPAWVAGRIGDALNFDGVNDYVDVGTFDVSGSGLTMMGWFNADALPDVTDPRIISKASSTAEADAWWQLSILTTGTTRNIRLRTKAGGTTSTLIDSSTDLNIGEWYFAVGTYSAGTGEMKLYLNGAEVASQSHPVGGAINTNAAVPVAIGANGSAEEFFEGTLDDIRVYDRALSASEIAALYTAGGGGGDGGGGSPPGNVVYEGFAEVNPSTTYNVNVPTPGGTVAGDLLIAAIASDEDASDLTAPAGWNTITVTNNGTRVTLGMWWKIAGASEPSSHTFTSSSYNMKYGWIMRFSGHDPVNPINATSTFDTGTSTDPPVASATTTVDNTLVLRVGGFDHDDITVDDPGLTGHTPITMDLGGSGLGACAGGAGYTNLPTAGATGTTNFALTKREEYVTGTIAIAPAP